MMKRITSLMLALVILLDVVFGGAVSVSAESTFVASDECIRILKLEEGFSKKPYWDYTQYTVGYGSTCPKDMVDYYTQNGITEEEAEVLLRNHLVAIERDLNQRIIDKYKLTLTQNQFDAMVLFSYNCGTGWTYETGGTFHNAIKNGATGNDLIRAFALWCSAGGEIKTYLLRRRLSEANMYLNNQYSQTPPDNYCYVIYDANGGYSSPRSQGYDSDLTAKPYPVPTYEGHTFDGWYTARTGGTKVTVLDASTKSKTLYAHWKNADGTETAPPKEDPVDVTVTGSDVNLRKGPGTNYTVIGSANKGDKLTITETAEGTGYRWGKFKENGWICLQFTNYDEAVKDAGEEKPPVQDPPEETKPEETEPEETKPEETKPADPKPQEKPTTWMGTVNVKEWLRVRSGAGTGYSVVKYLYPKDRVEILEKKTVGATVWGKIKDGWVSMDYIVLDKTETGSTGSTGSTGNTGSTGSSALTGVANVKEWLRVRSGPGTSYSIAGYLKPNEKVTITDQKKIGSTTWGKISLGWVSMDYIKLDKNTSGSTGSTGSTGNTGSTALTGVANVKEWLRVRSGPGTSYSIAGYLKPNEKVTITEKRVVGGTTWGKISLGWVSMDYIKLDSASTGNTGSNTQTQTKTVTADCLCVRSAAGTSNKIVGYLYYGAKVTILDTTKVVSTTWGKVSNGWIIMDYVK